MTSKDIELLEKARILTWEEASDLEDKAETAEGRNAIHRIILRGYHYAEAKTGMI